MDCTGTCIPGDSVHPLTHVVHFKSQFRSLKYCIRNVCTGLVIAYGTLGHVLVSFNWYTSSAECIYVLDLGFPGFIGFNGEWYSLFFLFLDKHSRKCDSNFVFGCQ